MRKILLVAGEVSADQHGAALIKELKKIDDRLQFFGIGGDALSAQGMDLVVHLDRMAFLGIGEVVGHLPYIRRVFRQLLERVRREKPQAAVLIDYPGFNLRLARSLKKMDIPVIYYISPQLWAWGKRRVKKIKRYVDKMLVLFPFEKDFYARHGIKAEYVGHPLVDLHAGYLPQHIKEIDEKYVSLGLLPGSRLNEVRHLLLPMVQTARRLYHAGKIHHAEIVRVPHIEIKEYRKFLSKRDGFISVVNRSLHEVLPAYDAAIVASGTATLETAYFAVPMLIVYYVNPLTFWLAKKLVKLKYIGLANIVAEERVAPELIQHDFQPQTAAAIISDMLVPKTNRAIRSRMEGVRKKLGQPGASARAAQIIDRFLKQDES